MQQQYWCKATGPLISTVFPIDFIDLVWEVDRLRSVGETKRLKTQKDQSVQVCLKWRQTLGSRSRSWLARRFVQVASRDMWKSKASQRSAALVNGRFILCVPGYCQTREKKERKSQWSHGKPPKPPLHQILLLCCQPFFVLRDKNSRACQKWPGGGGSHAN